MMVNIAAWFRNHYDKLIALIVLLGLLVSLGYLAVRAGIMTGDKKEFDKWLTTIPIRNPNVATVSTEALQKGKAQVENPFQVANGEWGNDRLLVPEPRIQCSDPRCRKPIPYSATNCPFCLTVVAYIDPGQRDAEKDQDGDGIPDGRETQFGLDPQDASDADKDPDDDGYTSRMECNADTMGLSDKPTDPKNATNHPPWEASLRLAGIRSVPVPLLFKGGIKLPATAEYPKGRVQHQLNVRGGGRTHLAFIGDVVEGFLLSKFEEVKVLTNDVAKGVGETLVDVSRLTLAKDGRSVVLTRSQESKWDEYVATLAWDVDGKEIGQLENEDPKDKSRPMEMEKKGRFKLSRNNVSVTYTIIQIDMKEQTVVIERADGRRFTIGNNALQKPKETAEKADDAVRE